MVDVLAEALDEQVEAAAWYEREEAGLGLRFLIACDRVVELISEHPGSGRRLRSSVHTTLRAHPVARFPFLVVYLESPQAVVVAFAHTSRKPDYWTDRLQGDHDG